MTKEQLQKANQMEHDIRGWQSILDYLNSHPNNAHDLLSHVNFRFNIPEDDSIVIELAHGIASAFERASESVQSRLDMLKKEFDSL